MQSHTKKELGIHPFLFPMPVLMIATYGEDGKVDVMNMAWGGICAENMVLMNLDDCGESHVQKSVHPQCCGYPSYRGSGFLWYCKRKYDAG